VDLAYILLSHWHGDHTGGVADLIAFDPSLAYRIYKHTPDPGQQAIADAQVFAVPGATVRAVYTPGHSTDHVCFMLEEENALFTGDNVLGHGFSVEEDLHSYMLSLHRMKELGCTTGYPAHGVKIDNLPRVMDRYIKHKEQRELQILGVLRERSKGVHSLSVQELIHAVHGDQLSDVVCLGLEPFTTQILWKLAEERKVGFEYVTGNRQWFLHKRFRKSQEVDI
jgi:hydrolase